MLKSTWQVIRPFVIVGTILGCILTGLLLAKISELRPKSAALRAEAIERYSGDAVIALARFVDDPGISFSRRNYAIGMLANLGDVRALPVLEKHYTGADCHHRYFPCQYELKKAVTRCRADLGKSILFRLLDADQITYKLTEAPAWLTINRNGVLTGTPDETGSYQLKVEASVEGVGADSRIFDVRIREA